MSFKFKMTKIVPDEDMFHTIQIFSFFDQEKRDT